ncbi:MAG TPA: DUF3137 domain-containing protein, partial [Phycisphaerae bacterium]|nr:DUF3137 domain-containing protein [Phycisphaerae bacterium]
MGFLRSIFGPSKDEIWGQIAKDIGGKYTDGGFFGQDVLRYRAGEWEITLDTYEDTYVNGSDDTFADDNTTYTRMRAPFMNKDKLYFKIYRKGIFSAVGKIFGMQDIEIGDKYFDDNFIIQGNNEEKIKLLLADPKLKELIQAQPNICFQIREDEGWFSTSFPDGVDELHFECYWVLKDEKLLKSLFEMF